MMCTLKPDVIAISFCSPKDINATAHAPSYVPNLPTPCTGKRFNSINNVIPNITNHIIKFNPIPLSKT